MANMCITILGNSYWGRPTGQVSTQEHKGQYIDRFHSIFHHRNWRAKASCDVDINQSAGSMVM